MKYEHDNKTVDWVMKANEFIRRHGLEVARNYNTGYNDDFSVELKRLIESHDLVCIHGFDKSKEIVANAPSDDHFYSWVLGDSGIQDKTVQIGALRKAIADVEACQ